MIDEFLTEMRRNVPEDARIMMCQFRGDPNADIDGKWRARVMGSTSMIDEGANVYFCVSAMRRNERGEFRRRKENFAGGLLLMIDDLGDGPSAKFPLSKIAAAPPSALIETSPGNFQAVYFFERLITDMAKFEGLIRAFIHAQFLGNDPGMAGVNRVFRPPVGVNGKAKYGGWRVRLQDWHPDRRYDVHGLANAFGLELRHLGARVPRGATADKAALIRAFVDVRAALRAAGMVKKAQHDLAGWAEITCPWVADHTHAADTGAAIRLPAEENGWTGAFRCHHGGCRERGWRELTQWLAEEQAEFLELVNRAAPEWTDIADALKERTDGQA